MAALDDDDVVLLPVTSGRSTGRKNKKKSKASSTGPGKKSAKVMRDTQSSMTTQLPSPSAEPSSSSGTEMPYGGDIAAAMKANDRQAIRVIMAARSTPAATAEVVIASTSGGSSNTTCPICNAERDDVEMLEHASGIATVGNITDHRACSECRASMIVTNSTCPWCRSEMVWRNLYGRYFDSVDHPLYVALCSSSIDYDAKNSPNQALIWCIDFSLRRFPRWV